MRAMDLTALVAVNFLSFFFLPDTSRFKHKKQAARQMVFSSRWSRRSGGSDYTFGDPDVRIGDVQAMLFNVF